MDHLQLKMNIQQPLSPKTRHTEESKPNLCHSTASRCSRAIQQVQLSERKQDIGAEVNNRQKKLKDSVAWAIHL